MKSCKICKTKFNQFNSLQVACSPKCALKVAEKKREKKEKQELSEFRNENKTIQKRIQEAQAAFNSYIRERDRYKPCVSCGATQSPQWDASHYKSRGAHPENRFNCLNCWKSCNKCNRFLSGNIVEYRKELINRIGLERVEKLENDNTPRKFNREYCERVKRIFNKRVRIIKKIRENKA